MDAPPVEVPLSICVFDKRKSAVDEEVGNASMSSCDTDDTDDQSGHGHLPTPANGSVESLLPYVQTAMTLNAPLPSKDGDPVASTMQAHHHGSNVHETGRAIANRTVPLGARHPRADVHETDLGGSGECEEDVHHPYDTPCHDASNASDTSLPLMELHRL
ncbi:hypothetical protein SYNPS1DRAFT_24805 [Syncephalis pseudoplumigaleata]|uniref:Uncharacterized protein n=1 Tax=Syncephalis pseudoplumigaleata TaxID=1712513 RepID=A0A4P9YTS0_9FUNG|nr:hypothetical protein SYNPS1DRAFT_24805 [Syncephalis pseudoplumigaleata]|eukprot:RKP23204.1 hypothetical protein SYNPS1DRAFT_24805 [Syncephalis pseudoplumigaleata]